MASAWGNSWGKAWGNSWGPITTTDFSGGHFYEFWRKKWQKKWKKKEPTIEEIVQFVKEKPAKALEIAKEIEPVKYQEIDTSAILANAKMVEAIADQILVAIKIQQIKMQREEEEIIIFLMVQ